MRVTGTGLLYRYRGSEWAEGFTHQFVGMIMLIPAFFMILAVGWALDHLFVEEADLAAPTGSKVLRRVAARWRPADADSFRRHSRRRANAADQSLPNCRRGVRLAGLQQAVNRETTTHRFHHRRDRACDRCRHVELRCRRDEIALPESAGRSAKAT